MAELNPAAQAGELILAYRRGGDEVPHPLGLATALEDLADQVAPETDPIDTEEWLGQSAWAQAEARIRFKIIAIAAELRGGANG